MVELTRVSAGRAGSEGEGGVDGKESGFEVEDVGCVFPQYVGLGVSFLLLSIWKSELTCAVNTSARLRTRGY
jgi:hypothetical protein